MDFLSIFSDLGEIICKIVDSGVPEKLANLIVNTEKFVEKFPVILIQLGWPPLNDLDAGILLNYVHRYDKYGLVNIEKDLNEYILKSYNKELLLQKLEFWRQQSFIQKRYSILEDIMEAHLQQKYNLSIPAMLPQIEGIIVDGFKVEGKFNGSHLKKYIKQLSVEYDFEEIGLIFREFYINTVLESFEHGKDINSSVSRHAILHGADIEYGTEENSLKLILLFDFLQDVIDERLKLNVS